MGQVTVFECDECGQRLESDTSEARNSKHLIASVHRRTAPPFIMCIRCFPPRVRFLLESREIQFQNALNPKGDGGSDGA